MPFAGTSMLSLTSDELHVWYVHPGSALSLLAEYERLLSQDERLRYERFVRDAERLRYLVSRALVRTTLSRYADIDPASWIVSSSSTGRPEIAGPLGAPRIRFSLSHTDGLIALAVTLDLDVGVDVERIVERTDCRDIARRFFATAEADAIEAASSERQPRMFLEYWTLKEAYAKATGSALSVPLESVGFQLSTPPVMSFDAPGPGNASTWHFSQLDVGPDHVGAVATRREGRPAVILREAVPLIGVTSSAASIL